jgi:hypothetical protein
MMAKKGIDNGEDCDSIPESMRQLLAMQAMESGKPFAPHLLGRPQGPMAPYGSGSMLMNGDPNGSGKVGMFFYLLFVGLFKTNCSSHPPLYLPLSQHWLLAPCWSECNGPGDILFA